MEDKRKVNINSILNKIDFLFSEEIQKSELNEGDICLDFIRQIDNIIYVKRAINRRDKAILKRIAESKLKQYLSSHSDNTLELFIETEIENAKKHQTYFPNYKSNSKEKTIYYDLQAWIEVIESLKVGRGNFIIFKSNEIAEVIDLQSEKDKAELDRIKKELEDIADPKDKKDFLLQAKKKYLARWDSVRFATSGVITNEIGYKELFMDRELSYLIDAIEENKNTSPLHDESISLAERFLSFLNGKSQANIKYMKADEYSRLIEYTNYLFTNLKLPKDIIPIKSNEIKAGEIRYSFYLMTTECYPSHDYPKVIFDFIGKVFPKLKDSKNADYKKTANYKKFKEKPQYYDSLVKR